MIVVQCVLTKYDISFSHLWQCNPWHFDISCHWLMSLFTYSTFFFHWLWWYFYLSKCGKIEQNSFHCKRARNYGRTVKTAQKYLFFPGPFHFLQFLKNAEKEKKGHKMPLHQYFMLTQINDSHLDKNRTLHLVLGDVTL